MEESSIYYINSDNRLNANDSHSDFYYYLNIPSSYTHCCVIHANIGVSYYTIRPKRDTFYLSEDGGNTYVQIVLNHGNYTFDVLKTELENKLNANSPNNFTYSISTDDPTTQPDTGKFTYNVTNNNGVQPKFKFDVKNDGLYDVMGFNRENEIYSFVNDTLVCPSIIYLAPEPTIFLHSDIVDEKDDVLQEFYAGNNINFSNISYECNDYIMYSKKLKNNLNKRIHFYFTTKNNLNIDFNGIGNVITLLCYKKSDLNTRIKNYIKYKLLQENKK